MAVAMEREVSMGFKAGHTAPACKRRGKQETGPFRSDDTVKCALVGNSFHTLPVSIIFSSQLCSLGFPHVLTTPARLQERFVEELLDAAAQASKVVANELEAAGILLEPPGPVPAEPSCYELDDEAAAVQGEIIAGCEEPLDESDRRPLSNLEWLVEGFVRSSEPRGGEVRLDLALPLFPKAAHRVSVDTRRWT